MNAFAQLKTDMDICDLHADRLQKALTHLKDFFPITSDKLQHLSVEELAFLDLMSNRFSKLQDTIAQKIFMGFLQALEKYEERDSFIDAINKLDKLEIFNVDEFWAFWKKMRKIPNEIAHEYPDDLEKGALKTNDCFEASHELLTFWESLKKTILERTQALEELEKEAL